MGGLNPARSGASHHSTARRLGVLGGTFDPPHRMHLALATAAADQLHLPRVLFLPAGDPWRKAHRIVSPAPHRLAMTRLAIAAEPRFACSDMELRRSGPTYTLQTLQRLAAQGWQALWFIVGSDAIVDLPHWHEPEQLIRTARLAVAVRPGPTLDAAALDNLVPGLSARLDWLTLPPDALSATALRHRIAAGAEPGAQAHADAPPAVLAYARTRGLYASSGDA